jgi:Glycosyl hydrolase catalytic core
MSKRAVLTTTTLLLAALLVTGLLSAGATASGSASKRRPFLVGIYDDTMTLGSPDRGFKTLKNLRAQVVRITLSWRAVARKRPVEGENPADKAYNWEQYDKSVQLAKKNNIKVMFSIAGTPAWANRGRSAAVAPTNFLDLQRFATAAATRYSGSFTTSDDPNAVPLPAVQLWLAWNEPNNPVFLAPQYKRVHGRWFAWSAYTYARICNAIYKGVHSAFVSGEKVGCGATDPFGNNKPKSFRPSISPLAFLRLSKKYGLRRFDAWAHHPYASRPTEKPTSKPRSKTAVTLGNFGDLTKELTRLYGKKRIWITEYGYQTRPPDHLFGVSWKNQARYLAEAFAIARKNPRVDMMIWFLVKDERRLGGWQSGFFTAAGKRKPAYTTFRALRH